jgi:hypothetical protein
MKARDITAEDRIIIDDLLAFLKKDREAKDAAGWVPVHLRPRQRSFYDVHGDYDYSDAGYSFGPDMEN